MIDILLSTYNGEKYLSEQIESILAQEGSEFRLLVRDDGSADSTVAIVERFAAADSRVTLVRDELGNLGVRRSFMTLVATSDAPLFMLCDQDDVWLREKIETSLTKMSEMQAKHGNEVPLLVFSDLTVTGDDLGVIDESFWHYQRLDPEICRDWRDLLAQNVVTGSTILANAATRRAALPFVLDEMMHDHWLAVNAARSGVVDYLATPLVLYRQHPDNAEGARPAGGKYLAGNINKLIRRMPFYQKAAEHFGGISAGELMFRKFRLNIRRMFGIAGKSA